MDRSWVRIMGVIWRVCVRLAERSGAERRRDGQRGIGIAYIHDEVS